MTNGKLSPLQLKDMKKYSFTCNKDRRTQLQQSLTEIGHLKSFNLTILKQIQVIKSNDLKLLK